MYLPYNVVGSRFTLLTSLSLRRGFVHYATRIKGIRGDDMLDKATTYWTCKTNIVSQFSAVCV